MKEPFVLWLILSLASFASAQTTTRGKTLIAHCPLLSTPVRVGTNINSSAMGKGGALDR